MFWFFGFKACGILVPQPGIKPVPSALKGEVLTAGSPGKSLCVSYNDVCHWKIQDGLISGFLPTWAKTLSKSRLQSLRDRAVQAGRRFPPTTPPDKPHLVFKALAMLTWELPCPFSHPDPPRVPPHAPCLPTPPPQKMSTSLFPVEAGQERSLRSGAGKPAKTRCVHGETGAACLFSLVL